jgi:hypothetical protein
MRKSLASSPVWVQAVRKLKIPKRDENDILVFDHEIEWACNAGTSDGRERLTCSIAIERPRVFTQPGSFATGASRQQGKLCAVCPESGSFQSNGGSARPLMPR